MVPCVTPVGNSQYLVSAGSVQSVPTMTSAPYAITKISTIYATGFTGLTHQELKGEFRFSYGSTQL